MNFLILAIIGLLNSANPELGNPLEASLQRTLAIFENAPIAYRVTIECVDETSGSSNIMYLQVHYQDEQHFRISGDSINLAMSEQILDESITMVADGKTLWIERMIGRIPHIAQTKETLEGDLGLIGSLLFPKDLLASLVGLDIETQSSTAEMISGFGIADQTLLEWLPLKETRGDDSAGKTFQVLLDRKDGFPFTFQASFVEGVTTRLTFSRLVLVSAEEMSAAVTYTPRSSVEVVDKSQL